MVFTDFKKHLSAFGVAVMVGLIMYLVSLYGIEQSKTEQNTVNPSGVVQESSE
jgi:hypothetical protein